MPTASAFAAFASAALLLNLAPGPDMLYVIGRSVGQGRRAGLVSALGIFTGCMFHILAAAFGLAALLRTSPMLYEVVRYAGAAYLVYLGIRIFTNPPITLTATAVEAASLNRVFVQGVITNVLNPKVALFFVSFLPQFVNPHGMSAGMQILFLGLIFNCSGTLVNGGVALAGGRLGNALGRNPAFARVQKWFTGTVFVGLGMRVALKRS